MCSEGSVHNFSNKMKLLILASWFLRGYQVPHKMLSPPYIFLPLSKSYEYLPLKGCCIDCVF